MAHSNNRYRREMYSLLSWHMRRTDLSPANKKAPLILFGEGENMYLLDGQNRINKAVNESLASMKCLVVRLK